MALDKLTLKLQEALQSAQQLASKSEHAELKNEHMLLALLQKNEGIATPILQKAGTDITRLKAATAAALDREPRVHGAGSQPQLGYALRATLASADEVRESLGDDYLSVEHFLAGLFKADTPAAKLLQN